MPSPFPSRDRHVYFAGAGLSCALGLPNTAQLLDSVFGLGESNVYWGQSQHLPEDLRKAFRFFYPDAPNVGFRPDTVDFFSALTTYIGIGSGLVGTGFADAPQLLRALKFAIAHVLVERLRAVDTRLKTGGHQYLDRMVQPGNIVITSNWDLAIERYAQHRGIPVRYGGSSPNNLVVLKLHGSIDWCRREDCSRDVTRLEYGSLRELLFAKRAYAIQLPTEAEALVRVRSLEQWADTWRKIKSRANDLHMVTMVRGKSEGLGPLGDVWRDAYGALSRAETLEVVGYSMPPDDTEIRTLIRTGTQRGISQPLIIVRNPSPDVHDRFRSCVSRGIESVYTPVNSV